MSTRRKRGLATAAVVLGLVLGGCAAQPGAAAVVDGQRIGENQVARAVADFTAVTGQPVDTQAMLSTLIIAPILLDVAAQGGVAASDAEAVALLDGQAQALGRTAPEEGYGEGVIQVAKMTIVNQGLMTAPNAQELVGQVNERVAQADIEVSPRYGDFDPNIGQIVTEPLPWIAPGQ